MEGIVIDGHHLTLKQVHDVARNHARVSVSEEALKAISKAEEMVKRYVEEERISYGITTGFGKFSDVYISKDETAKLQKNLIMSHACGVGEPFKEEVVRAMMLLRLNSLAQGHSGIRKSTFLALLNMLNHDVYPLVYEKGSLGASGDLCPLAHMTLVLLGLGEAFVEGKRVSGAEALAHAGLHSVELTAKEGLSLINGTQAMCAVGTLACYDALTLSKVADMALSLTMETLGGIRDAFDERVQMVRPHAGQIHTARNVLSFTTGSTNLTKQGETRVQDPYTLRCAPQVHGACKDAIAHVHDKLLIEINSVTDNPILFVDDDYIISGGNFHGESVALAFDYLGIAVSELANISERRLERLVNPALSYGLPAFLSENGGVNSGYMIVQYAAASLVSENKVLAHPASVDSIPSSANQEDHVSMGTIAARKSADIIENTSQVLAMELLAAAQGMDLRGCQDKCGKGTSLLYKLIREKAPYLAQDDVMYPYIHAIQELLYSEEFMSKIETSVKLEEV